MRLARSLLLAVLLLFLPGPVHAAEPCHRVPITANTPSGIAGCYQWGQGKASEYGPGSGVAMNFCTWSLRTSSGCGWVRIQSLDTGLTVIVQVVDYCDCYWLSDRRLVDLQYGAVAALGLDQSLGMFEVSVERLNAAAAPALPNTATAP